MLRPGTGGTTEGVLGLLRGGGAPATGGKESPPFALSDSVLGEEVGVNAFSLKLSSLVALETEKTPISNEQAKNCKGRCRP